MATLTAQQANELSTHFLTIAEAIGAYRYQHFDNLLKAENQQIKDLHTAILNYADQLYTLSATLVIDDVEAALYTIAAVTTEIKSTYKILQNVQKAINVAAASVTLGEAILSRDPKEVIKAVKGLEQNWKS